MLARCFHALLALALCTSSTALPQGALRADADSTTEAEIQALVHHLIDLSPARQVPSDMHVRVYGDTAILSFILTTEREGESPVRARLVKVFVRREGRWIMVNNQGTPLE